MTPLWIIYFLKSSNDYSLNLYILRADGKLPRVGLALALWEGIYEGQHATWLRWYDDQGKLIPTGAEQAERAERLAAKLRALGLDPDQV